MFGNKKFTLAILHKFSDQSLFFLYDTSAICFLSLTGEQKKVLDTALAGHNLLLCGQAGTGK